MSTRFQQGLSLSCGAIALALGLLALVAWATDRTFTLGPLSGRLRPELAVGLFFGGAGVLCAAAGRTALLLPCAAVAALAGGAVLLEVALAAPGLPLALAGDDAAGSTVLVAAAILVTGLGLALLRRWPDASLMLGLLSAGVGFILLLDRALEATAPLSLPDAVATSARTGLALLGLGGGLSLEASRRRLDDRSVATPWMVGAVGVVASLLFWNILTHQERAGLDRLLEATAAGLRAELSVAVNEVIGEVEILAERAGRAGPDADLWQTRTRRVMRLHPSVVAIDWIAPDGTLLGSARSETLAQAVALSYPTADEIERLRTDFGDVPSALVQAYPQLPESLRITALVQPGDAGGVLETVIDMRQLVSGSVTATDLANAIRITVGDVVVFDNPGTNPANLDRSARMAASWRPPAADHWRIVVGPSHNLVVSALSPLPNVVLGAGILISLLLAAVLRGNEIQRRRAVELERAVRVVETQAAELRRAQQRLKELNEDLEDRVRARTDELSRANAYLSEENRLRKRAQQHLTRVNENLHRFDAFISHELRQPLAAMRLWMDLLESTAGGALTEQQKGYLDKASGEIRRMTRLIEDELRLSKASHGEPPSEPVSLDAVLANIADELSPRLDEMGGRLEVGELAVVRASETQMRQLFTNLIDNAVKYRRPDVPPLIRVERIDSPAAGDDGDAVCEIVVTDNGQGFSVEGGDVFAMFSRRAGNDTTPGWGIGLAICKRIAERHDGAIWADSEPGVGTRVHVALPLAIADAGATAVGDTV